MQYRPEIDGLRAFAILPVLFYHAGFAWMPGGWLGVDVFFVISGFLITGILLRDLESGSFSLTRFYERRARRIMPALTVVVLATMAAAPFFMWPWQIAELGQSVIATAIFIANLFFEAQVDYFRTDAEQYPLIHMWSLAIEEQYYVFLPLVLLALWKLGVRAKGLFVVLGGLAALSLMAAHGHAAEHPSATFYQIQYRAYELCAGSLAALLAYRGYMFKDGPARAATAMGLALIVASVVLVKGSGGDPLLRVAALAGTAFILLSNVAAGGAFALLTHPAIRFFGLISFSLYLWHQPILSFMSLHPHEPSLLGTAGLLVLSISLATVSWRFIEQPFRSTSARRETVLGVAFGAIVVMSCLGLAFATQAEKISPIDAHDADLAVAPHERSAYVRDGYNALKGKSFTDDGRPKVLLIGDSFSQDFYNVMAESGQLTEFDLVTHYVSSKCQIYFGSEDVLRHVRPDHHHRCPTGDARLPRADVLAQADTILIASHYRAWMVDRLEETLANLQQLTTAELIIIGAKNFGPFKSLNLHDFSGMSVAEKARQRVQVTRSHMKVQSKIRDTVQNLGLAYVDMHAALCGQAALTCPIFTPEGRLITFDAGHLTKAGAAHVGKELFHGAFPFDGIRDPEEHNPSNLMP
jgi:peptidoglycan/LPS O-acetylase OafA/YrhL